jgi:hypothetical protein
MLKRRLRERAGGSLDGVLFGTLLFDISRKRFGDDSSRTEIPEAAAHVRSGSIGDLSREIAAYTPIAPVVQFETRRWQCGLFRRRSTSYAAGGLPASGVFDPCFYRLRLFNARVSSACNSEPTL